MELSQPLSDEEFGELDRFLMSDATPEECMDAMLDGFFTALAIGPNLVMPSQWLSHVWGGATRPSARCAGTRLSKPNA